MVKLNAVQGYTGGTTLKTGTLDVVVAGGAGTGTILLGDTSGSLSATLFGENINIANAVTVQAGNTGAMTLAGSQTATPTFSGTITLNNTNLVRLNKNTATAGGSVTISGLVTGAGGFYVGSESFAAILTHANTYSGGTRLDKGTLQIGNDAALGNGTLTFNNNSALTTTATTFQSTDATARTIANAIGTFGGTTANYTYAFGGTGTGALTFTNTTASSLNGTARIFQVDSNTSFANAFTSTGGAITKTGNATLALSGASTYTGDTTVTVGTLLANTPVSGTNSATGTGTVSVSSTGTLGGTGQITPGTVKQITVANGGAIAPGAGGIGTLTINGFNTGSAVLSLASGAKFAFELNSTGLGNFQSDKLVLLNGVSGDIAFGGNAINFTDLTSGGTLAHGAYILFSATAANNYGGSFSTDSSGFVTGGLSIGTGLGVYTGSTLQLVGTDIVLNVVPEPTTWGLLAFSLTTVMVLRRRRRQ